LGIFFSLFIFVLKQIRQKLYVENNHQPTIQINEKSTRQPLLLGTLSYEKALFRRNKRIKTVLIVQTVSLFFIGLLNLVNNREQSMMFRDMGLFKESMYMVFMGFTVTYLPIIFLSFTFTAESTFLDAFVSRPIHWRKFLLIKWKIASTLTLIYALIVLPIVWFTFPKMLIWLPAYCLFQIGIGNFILLFKITFHTTPFHIDTSAWFNYEGVSFAPFSIEVLSFVPLVIPPVWYALFATFHIEVAGVALLSLLGIMGILLYQKWIDFLLKSWESRRYEILEGFRRK
jgi:hypothetical protein